MLLNLSNHPFTNWSELQKTNAIEQYHEVIDIPFPHIDPNWSSDEVLLLVDEYVSKVMLMPPATLHVMGELTFVFYFVEQCKAIGIPCVASTTERIVQERDGQKVSTFRFVKFRPYF